MFALRKTCTVIRKIGEARRNLIGFSFPKTLSRNFQKRIEKEMKTKSKTSGHIIRSGVWAVFLSVAFIALSSAFNSPNGWHKTAVATVDYDTTAKIPSQPRTFSFAERVAYQRAIEDVYWRHRIWPKREPQSQAVARRGDVSGATGKKVGGYLHDWLCWKKTGKNLSLVSSYRPRWTGWHRTQNSRKSCGNCLRLLETIRLSSPSVWPDQH